MSEILILIMLLMPAFALPVPPTSLATDLHRFLERSPTRNPGKPGLIRSFGFQLEPRCIFGALLPSRIDTRLASLPIRRSNSELLRTL